MSSISLHLENDACTPKAIISSDGEMSALALWNRMHSGTADVDPVSPPIPADGINPHSNSTALLPTTASRLPSKAPSLPV